MKKSHIFLAASIALLAACASAPVAPTNQVDMSKPPQLGPVAELNLPPVIQRELPNGLRLMIVEQHELPVADFILAVGSGGTVDPQGKAGTANLTALMLREGTTTRSSLDIADQIAFLGVNLGTGTTWDAATVSLHTPTAQLDSALALFADVALHPSFPDREFDRLKKNRQTEILQIRDRGPAIADQAFASIVFGTQYPYGNPLIGTQQSIENLKLADLQAFYRTQYRPNNTTLIVVGDVNTADMEQRLRNLFGGWERGEIPPVNFGQPAASGPTTVYLIDKPGAPQSSFRIGAIAVPRSTKDFFALTVLNTALGGSFSSRLNNTLREVRAFTYGARSGFDMRRMAGPFTASAEIVAAKSDSALTDFMHELRSVLDTIPSDELARAKRYTELRLPWSFETTQQIATAVNTVALYGLPTDYYNNYVRNIEAVTQADVQRVARQYIRPESLAIVIVGDRKTIEPGLRAINIAPIVIRDIGGQPIQ